MGGFGNTHGVAALGLTDLGHASRDRLEYKSHVCAGAGVDGGGFFLPDGVDVFVELGVDAGTGTAVVMTIGPFSGCLYTRIDKVLTAWALGLRKQPEFA
jgi:hypothetical protein